MEQFRLVENAIDLINDPNLVYYPYKSDIITITGFFLYLFQKHKNVCIPLATKLSPVSRGLRVFAQGLTWTCQFTETEQKRTLSYDPETYDKILACLKHPDPNIRFVVIPLNLEYIENCRGLPPPPPGAKYEVKIGHQNVLIIDRHKNEGERLDPMGLLTDIEWFESMILDEQLSRFFEPLGLKYVPLSAFCPSKGIQAIQAKEEEVIAELDPGGFCAAWSVWWADMRLTFPDMDRQKLLQYAIDILERHRMASHPARSFTQFIRAYTAFITQWKLSLLKSIIKDIYTDVTWYSPPTGKAYKTFTEVSPRILQDPTIYWIRLSPDGTVTMIKPQRRNNQLIIPTPTGTQVMNIAEIPELTIGYFEFDDIIWLVTDTTKYTINVFAPLTSSALEDPSNYWVLKQTNGTIVPVTLRLQDDELTIQAGTKTQRIKVQDIPDLTIGYVTLGGVNWFSSEIITEKPKEIKPTRRTSYLDPEDFASTEYYWLLRQEDGTLVFVRLELQDDTLIIHAPTGTQEIDIDEIPELTIGFVTYEDLKNVIITYVDQIWKTLGT